MNTGFTLPITPDSLRSIIDRQEGEIRQAYKEVKSGETKKEIMHHVLKVLMPTLTVPAIDELSPKGRALQATCLLANYCWELSQTTSKTGKTEIQISLQQIQEISPLLCCTDHIKHVVALVNKVFTQYADMTITANSDSELYTLHWRLSNPWLKPKYPFPVQTEKSDKAYFKELLQSRQDADIQFQINGEIVFAHSLLLKKAPYFKKMLGTEWKERRMGEPIALPATHREVFKAMLSYVYTDSIEETFFQDDDNMLELLKFSHHLQYQPLFDYCLNQVNQKFCSHNFVKVALTNLIVNHPHLEELCLWFVQAYKSFDQSLDFGLNELMLYELLETWQIAKKYGLAKLETEALSPTHIQLDKHFIDLCHKIRNEKDAPLKRAFKAFLKANPHFEQELERGRTDLYATHWDAYALLICDPSF